MNTQICQQREITAFSCKLPFTINLFYAMKHVCMWVYTISYTLYNCPNTEKYRASPNMNLIDPIFSVLGQLYTV
jgi:hypothetical protein